jgi:hypothetical protein
MTEQIPQEVLDAIRAALEETARQLAREKAARPVAAAQVQEAQSSLDDDPPGTRPH